MSKYIDIQGFIESYVFSEADIKILKRIVKERGCYSIICEEGYCPMARISKELKISCASLIGLYGFENTHSNTGKFAQILIDMTEQKFWRL